MGGSASRLMEQREQVQADVGRRGWVGGGGSCKGVSLLLSCALLGTPLHSCTAKLESRCVKLYAVYTAFNMQDYKAL